MKHVDTHALLRTGAIARAKELEHELRELHRIAPDVFLSATAPVLLKAELRDGIPAQRASSDQLLQIIKEHGPIKADAIRKRGGSARGLGSLVRREYVKKTKTGYVRTSKPYEV